MRFTLFYRGSLKANRGAADKQKIRRYFHPQLKRLWAQAPLSDYTEWFLSPEPKPGEISLLETVGDFQFAPLVSERIYMVAEINITMLRPGDPGDLVRHSGDLDNRIKTLLDALRVPSAASEIPKNDKPQEDESPLFCLLSDDKLITHLSISTDSLLECSNDKSEVVMLIHVTTRPTRLIYANMGLGSS